MADFGGARAVSVVNLQRIYAHQDASERSASRAVTDLLILALYVVLFLVVGTLAIAAVMVVPKPDMLSSFYQIAVDYFAPIWPLRLSIVVTVLLLFVFWSLGLAVAFRALVRNRSRASVALVPVSPLWALGSALKSAILDHPYFYLIPMMCMTALGISANGRDVVFQILMSGIIAYYFLARFWRPALATFNIFAAQRGTLNTDTFRFATERKVSMRKGARNSGKVRAAYSVQRVVAALWLAGRCIAILATSPFRLFLVVLGYVGVIAVNVLPYVAVTFMLTGWGPFEAIQPLVEGARPFLEIAFPALNVLFAGWMLLKTDGWLRSQHMKVVLHTLESFRVAWREFKIASALSADRALSLDRRAPILFLRSFVDDQTVTAGSSDVHLHENTVADITRLEEIIALEMWRFGPVVALNDPGSNQANLGAAKVSVSDSDWRDVIVGWMDQSSAICVMLGGGANLKWEIDQIIARAHATKTVLIFPPGQYSARAAAEMLAGVGLSGPQDAFQSGNIICYSRREGGFVALDTGSDSAVAYQLGVYCGLRHAIQDTALIGAS